MDPLSPGSRLAVVRARRALLDDEAMAIVTVTRRRRSSATCLAPSKARYEAFMKEWGEARDKETTEYAQKNYPAMRKMAAELASRLPRRRSGSPAR